MKFGTSPESCGMNWLVFVGISSLQAYALACLFHQLSSFQKNCHFSFVSSPLFFSLPQGLCFLLLLWYFSSISGWIKRWVQFAKFNWKSSFSSSFYFYVCLVYSTILWMNTKKITVEVLFRHWDSTILLVNRSLVYTKVCGYYWISWLAHTETLGGTQKTFQEHWQSPGPQFPSIPHS